jgi:DNA (cytosine-5)-methyltransferase 1
VLLYDLFDGVIGGSPCQDFSRARRSPTTGDGRAMLGEFLRVVAVARSKWFLLENVPGVPDVELDGYTVQRIDVDQGWWSGTRRRRHIQFGRHKSILSTSQPLDIPRGKITEGAELTALASDSRPFAELCRLQGLPDGFDLSGMTEKGKCQAVGNGVPLVMGRHLAQAVRMAVYGEAGNSDGFPAYEYVRRLCVICGRRISGKQVTCSASCRKKKSRRAAGTGTGTGTGTVTVTVTVTANGIDGSRSTAEPVTTESAATSRSRIRSVTAEAAAASRFDPPASHAVTEQSAHAKTQRR